LHLTGAEEETWRVAAVLDGDYLPLDKVWVQGGEAFRRALESPWNYDLIIIDDQPSATVGYPAPEALEWVLEHLPNLPVLVLTGAGEEAAVAWLRRGATESLPTAAQQRLAPAVRRLVREGQTRAALRQAAAERDRLGGLLRSVMESTHEGILILDLAGKILTYNRKFMSLCGIPEYVLAPMRLDRVLQFLQEQFLDPQGLLSEMAMLGEPGSSRAGLLAGRDQRALEVRERISRMDSGTDVRVIGFSEQELRGEGRLAREAAAGIPQNLLDAAQTGRVVPWFLNEEELVISHKGGKILGIPAEALPRDLRALEAMIHPDDLDLFRRGLERPQQARFDLRMRKGDGSWLRTRWSLKRGKDGYRGIFLETSQPLASAEAPAHYQYPTAPSYRFDVKL
jgi:PAS domain-containing protein